MGRILPADEEHKEYWTWRPAGTLPWFIRVCQDPKSVFRGGEIDHNIREITSAHSSFDEMKVHNYVNSSHNMQEKDIVQEVGTREMRVPYPQPSFDKTMGRY